MNFKISKLKKGKWSFEFYNLDTIPVYQGSVFNSINDSFSSGILEGRTLLDVFNQYPKMVYDYIFDDYIFITNEALKELVNKYGEQDPHIRTLINGRDINFSFNKSQIHSADMPINGIAGCRNFDGKTICERKLQNSYYYGTSLKKIFEVHPNYIISLINSGKISISRKACDELKEFSYYTKLLKAIEEKKIEKEEEERERQMQDDAFWDDYDNNYNANRGYQDAFDGDPDAEWNVY